MVATISSSYSQNFLCIPQPLQKGDTIAIVAPAGQLHNKELLQKGVAILQEMGFSVKFPRSLWPGDNYLADNDSARAEEFNRIWADDEVSAIMALRGGFGSLRMIGGIDFELIRRKPKLFIGFSDITILLNLIYQKTGVVSLHAPVLTSLATTTPAALERLYFCLTTALIKSPPFPIKGIEILRNHGEISERFQNTKIIGGNLATLTTLLGTQWDFDYSGNTLLLEDVGEPLYKIDRMLTQLLFAGKFSAITGVILGNFYTPEEHPKNAPIHHLRYTEAIWKRILECLDSVENNCPVYAGFPIGHVNENLAIPIGAPFSFKDSIRG